MVAIPDPDASAILKHHVLPNLPEGWSAVLILIKLPPRGFVGVADTPTQVAANVHNDVICQAMEASAAQIRRSME